jgi:hypothetical protein
MPVFQGPNIWVYVFRVEKPAYLILGIKKVKLNKNRMYGIKLC